MLPASCKVPGSRAQLHKYWLYPVVIEDSVLRQRVCSSFCSSTMFDVGTKPSQLCVVAPPQNSEFAHQKVAQTIISNSVFLPCRRGVPESVCDLLVRTIVQADLRPY